LPYRDIEARRRCSRESKRRARARLAQPEFRAYIFPRQPFCRVAPGASFEYGICVVADPTVQSMIEGHREYGQNIFRVALVKDSEE